MIPKFIKKPLLFFVLILIFLSFLAGMAGGAMSVYIVSSPTNKEEEIDIVEQSSSAVIHVVATRYLENYGEKPSFSIGNSKISEGSGFIISKEGLIITNHHVVDDPEADYSVIFEDGRIFKATIVKTDVVRDLAMLKIYPEEKANFIFSNLTLGNSDELKVGQKIIAIGNMIYNKNTVTMGIISAINRPLIKEVSLDFLQTDTLASKGSSGSPLLNLKGEVVGMIGAISTDVREGAFAISSNDIKSFLKSGGEMGFEKRQG